MCDLCNAGYPRDCVCRQLLRHTPRCFPCTRERHHLGTALGRVYGPQLGERYVTVGGGVWHGVTKRYEGVGGCQIYGKKALRNT